MLFTFLIMLLVIAICIGWGVYKNVFLYMHGAIATRRFVRSRVIQTVSRAASGVSPDNLFSAQVDDIYDNNRRLLRRVGIFFCFAAGVILLFVVLLLNALPQ